MESVVRILTAGLVDAGVDVHAHVVTESEPPPDIVGHLSASGVSVHVTCVPGRRYDRERAETRRLCRELDVGVVHCHGYRADVVDAGVARAEGVPVVSTVHGFTGGGWKNAIYEWLQLRALRKMDRVVAVSAPLEDLLRRRGVPGEAIRVLANAYTPPEEPLARDEARERLDLPRSGAAVGWIGRMSPEKGPDVFVEAARRVGRDDVHWVMIGDGPERTGAEEAARPLGGRARFTGLVPDAGRLVRAFDALVLSSRTEGTPMVALEAMAAGVPVVATAVGGVPDLLEGGAGVLVPPENPGELADAITSVVDLRDAERAGLVEAARHRLATRFGVAPWIEAHVELYRSVGRRA
jgi:glycosyltransferase involved in cell wall biosynthesis